MFYNLNAPLIEVRRREELNPELPYFFSCDSKESFEKGKDKFGTGWYYYNNPINYEFNSFGYRTSELHEIDDNFIVSFGCSFTMGIGLHKKDIWIEKLGEKLGKKTLNLALEGVGNSTTFYNSFLFFEWCKKNSIKPDGVFIQLTFNHRREFFYTTEEKEINIGYTPSIINPTDEHDIDFYQDAQWFKKRYNADSAERTVISDIYPKVIKELWGSIGTPVFFFSFGNDFKKDLLFTNDIEVEEIQLNNLFEQDYARDLLHNGRKEHELAASCLALKYQTHNG